MFFCFEKGNIFMFSSLGTYWVLVYLIGLVISEEV